MLSQPATKIFLRTSEPRAGKWIADTIGDVEIERLRESRSQGRSDQQTYGLERQVEPLVMASEISGLAALRGYLKMGNLVVRLSVPFIDLPKTQPVFIERQSRPRRPASPLAIAAQGTATSADGHDAAPAVTSPQEQERRPIDHGHE